jgi:hypothetical protein
VQLVNAYVVYCKVMEANSIPKKDWLSHYDFRKVVALDWINEKADNVARKRIFLTMVEEGDPEDDTPTKKSNGKTSANKNNKTGEGSANRRSSTQLNEKEEEPEVLRRSIRVTDGSLAPDGALSKRLRRDLFHWPKQAKPNQRCTLHH